LEKYNKYVFKKRRMDKEQLEKELGKRLTSRGLLRYAWDYYRAFEVLYEKFSKVTEMYEVKYYLLCHSIELAMKAFLREKGFTRKQLLGLGHDLEKLIRTLYENGVVIDVESMKRTFSLNDYYKTKQFEYPQTGSKSLPSLDAMKSSTHLLLSMVRNSITRELPGRKR